MSLGSILSGALGKAAKDALNQTQRDLNQKIRTSGNKLSKEISDQVGKKIANAACHKEDVKFDKLPSNLQELLAMGADNMTNPYKTVAYCILALNLYPTDKEAAIEMLDYLNGPAEVNNFSIQKYDFQLNEKPYIMRGYFKGAVPANDYTASQPYTIHVEENPYSKNTEGYLTLFATNNGADSPRQVTLRSKGNNWYVWEPSFLISDIRIPQSLDDWADTNTAKPVSDGTGEANDGNWN